MYGDYARRFPEQVQVAAVAEPHPDRLARFLKKHPLPKNRQFNTWQELAAEPRLADAVIISTQDHDHVDAVNAFAVLGYHILVEKPIAHTEEGCRALAESAARYPNQIMSVGHVLRYTPFYRKLKSLIDDGAVGDIATVQQLEPVGYTHQAHSFVRGNWGRTDTSTPMVVAKCCHDMDILLFLLDKKCMSVSSFGHLKHFRAENRPEGAADRCIDCSVERDCPYSARKQYVEPAQRGNFDFPVHVLTATESMDDVHTALREGPYGRCVYDCDNDVVDHQVVSMDFEDQITATLTMTAFTQGGFREIYIMGTRGTLRGSGDCIEHFDVLTEKRTEHSIPHDDSGHSGGDDGIVRDFVTAVSENNPALNHSPLADAFESHHMAFAAERSRLHRRVELLHPS